MCPFLYVFRFIGVLVEVRADMTQVEPGAQPLQCFENVKLGPLLVRSRVSTPIGIFYAREFSGGSL